MKIQAATLLVCVIGTATLATFNAFAQAEGSGISGVPVFQAETAKDAQQDEHMAGIDAKLAQMQGDREAAMRLAQDNHDRLVRDEAIVYGVFAAIGFLQAAGLLARFKTRTAAEM